MPAPSSHADLDAVLRRFVRRYVETFPTRRALRSRQLLKKAFDNCQTMSRPNDSAIHMEKLVERRKELVRRYSASAPVATEPLIMRKSSVACNRGEGNDNEEDALKIEESSDDSEPQHEQHHVTFELVVQHLHSQIEELRQQNATKDSRIAELEAIVARLTTENRHLRHTMHLTKTPTTASTSIHQSSGNQRLTT